MTAAIEFARVSQSFRQRPVLTDVDLEVPRGQITVLLGPSGAGKTVTIKHALGLYRPSRGAVRVNGQNLKTLTEEQLNDLRRSMGVVLQGTLPFTCGLFYSLNVFENVAFALREQTPMTETAVREATLGWLTMMGLREWAEAMPNQLSAGMTKRVALARALAVEPRMVIVDDFDSGIDGVRLHMLCDLLRDSQRESGATYLVATHDMRAARQLADSIAVIHEGKIVAAGEAENVLGSNEPFVRQLLTGATTGPLGLRG